MIRALKRMSSEEILEVLDRAEPDVAADNNEAADFIIAMKFERGGRRMPFSLIYTMYKIWSDTPMNRWQLGRELRLRFERRRDRYSVYYLMKSAPKRQIGRKY